MSNTPYSFALGPEKPRDMVVAVSSSLASLVYYTCNTTPQLSPGVPPWRDALEVSTPPIKLRQNTAIDYGMIEVLLLLAHTCFRLVNLFELGNAHHRGGDGTKPLAPPRAFDNGTADDAEHTSGLAVTKDFVTAKLALMKRMKGMEIKALDLVGSLAYKAIKMIAKDNKKTVRQIKLVGGIDLMIKHRLGSSDWNPPITDLLSINREVKLNGGSNMRVISKTDIEQLLDNVYRSIQRHEDPDPEIYRFLVDMCTPQDPDTHVQGWTRDLMLGGDYATAADSCFLYGIRVLPSPKGNGSRPRLQVDVNQFDRPRPRMNKGMRRSRHANGQVSENMKEKWVDLMSLDQRQLRCFGQVSYLAE